MGANGGVHEFADSQFGHLFATGEDREAARKALVLALKELKVRGEIRNPVEYLVQLLETDDFKSNNIDTSWLVGILAAKSINTHVDDSVVVASAARGHGWAKGISQWVRSGPETFKNWLLLFLKNCWFAVGPHG